MDACAGKNLYRQIIRTGAVLYMINREKSAGKRETNPGAIPRPGIYPYAPAMSFDDRTRQVQPQSRPFRSAAGLFGAVKAVEDVGNISGGNPPPSS